MAKTYDTTADWREVSPDLLTANARAKYDAYKAAARAAAEAKADFESEFAAIVPLPAGKRYGFGYRFGKLSVAILEGEPAKAARAAPAPRSLADLLGIRSI